VAKGADRRGVPDLAILRLSSASRRPVHPVSRQGFPAGELFRMEKVTPVDGVPGIVGRQEENRDCSAMSDSFFAPLFTHAGSPVVSLTGCPTVNGNSGSPIFGADGTLRGLHFAADDADDEWFRAKHLNVKGKRPLEINYNDNFSCLSLPAEAGAGDAGASCRSAPLENAAYRAVRQAGGVVGLSFNDFESYEPVRDAHGRELRISVDEVGRILRIR